MEDSEYVSLDGNPNGKERGLVELIAGISSLYNKVTTSKLFYQLAGAASMAVGMSALVDNAVNTQDPFGQFINYCVAGASYVAAVFSNENMKKY